MGGEHPECVQAEASPRSTPEHFCIEHIECIIIECLSCLALGHFCLCLNVVRFCAWASRGKHPECVQVFFFACKEVWCTLMSVVYMFVVLFRLVNILRGVVYLCDATRVKWME